MSFVGSFHAGATSVLAGALMTRRAPRPRVHTVTVNRTDTANVQRLVAALDAETARAARLQAEVDRLRLQLAVADELLQMADED